MVRGYGFAAVLAFAALASHPVRSESGPTPTVDLASAKNNAATAAEAWLALVDAEQYGESWTRASALFRQKVTQEQWVATAKVVRNGLGPLRARTFESASSTEVEGGTMVVLLWKSSFEGMHDATEQVTMMQDDGSWWAAGYFVRPR